MNADKNPVFETIPELHGAIPFDRIKPGDHLPALEMAIAEARERIEAIAGSPAPPDYRNTIEALEFSDEDVDRAAEVFFNLLATDGSDEMQTLAREISPRLAEYSNDVTLNERLYARVDRVHSSPPAGLGIEERRLLEKVWKRFTRNGARLDSAGKARLREIDRELSELSPRFAENVLKATNAFELWIADRSELAGLPPSAVEAAAAAARARNREGTWLFTLHAPSYIPFVTWSDRRELREKIWRAYASRSFDGEYDNTDQILRTVRLRNERAKLLGFASHAHFVLEERMARDPDTVQNFLERLRPLYRNAAERDLEDLRDFRERLEGTRAMEPWDVAYYSEKLKKERYQIDQEELRPYLPLDRVIAGAFEHAARLFEIEFSERKGYPVWHPEVRVFEARDRSSSEYLGLLYLDLFPRKEKRSGAWMTLLQTQGMLKGEIVRPHVGIVCNFTPATETRPALLLQDEMTTFFHELGHALHALLSRCRYRSLSGTNVLWDFVELPSQIMENWTQEAESLDLFARHHETGEPIPDETKRMIKESSKFLSGTAGLRQILFAALDLAWHIGEPAGDVDRFETEVTAPFRILPKIPGTSISTSFQHIFSGGYSAGYYSYKWAEVLDADAFELFKEKGLFHKESGRKFRDEILAKGDTEPPEEIYRRFRGRDPDPDALLRREGVI